MKEFVDEVRGVDRGRSSLAFEQALRCSESFSCSWLKESAMRVVGILVSGSH